MLISLFPVSLSPAGTHEITRRTAHMACWRGRGVLYGNSNKSTPVRESCPQKQNCMWAGCFSLEKTHPRVIENEIETGKLQSKNWNANALTVLYHVPLHTLCRVSAELEERAAALFPFHQLLHGSNRKLPISYSLHSLTDGNKHPAESDESPRQASTTILNTFCHSVKKKKQQYIPTMSMHTLQCHNTVVNWTYIPWPWLRHPLHHSVPLRQQQVTWFATVESL